MSRLVPCVLFALLAVPAFAEKRELKVRGALNFELGAEDRYSTGSLKKEGRLEVSTRRRGGVRGVTDVEISSDSRGLQLRELYVDYKTGSGSIIQAGQAKKQFGLEWDLDLKDRLTLQRGPVYRKLAAFGYVGRDSLLRLGMEAHDFSLHSSEGLNVPMLYRHRGRLDEETDLLTYTLVQADSFEKCWVVSPVQALTYVRRGSVTRLEGELFAGRDPIESQFQAPRNVYFGAMTLGAAWRRGRLEPFARATGIVHDLSSWENPTLELTLGSRLRFAEGFEAGGEGYLSRGPDSAQGLLLATRYFF